MAKNFGDLLVKLNGDGSGFKAMLQEAERGTRTATGQVIHLFERVESTAKRSRADVSQLASGISQIGAQAGIAGGRVAQLGNVMVASLAAGPLVAVTTAVGLGIGALVTKYREASTAAAASAKVQVASNEDVKESIDKIVQSIAAQVKAQNLQLFGSNASTEEMVDQWMAHNAEVDKAEAAYQRLQKEWVRLHELSKEDRSGVAERLKARAEAPMLAAERALNEARKEQADFKAKFDAFTTSQQDLEEIQALLEEQKKLDKKAETKAAGPNLALQAELRTYDLMIARAKLLGDRELEIEATRDRALVKLRADGIGFSAEEYTAAEQNILAEAAKAKEALREEEVRREEDRVLRIRTIHAQATKTQVDDLEVAMDQEVAAYERAAAARLESEEQTAAAVAEIRSAYQARLAAASEAEAKAASDALARAALDEKRISEHATIAGMQAGSAFAQGIRAAIQTGDPMAAFRGMLQGLAGLLTAFGNPVAGAGLNIAAGFLADGGLVHGIGGPRDDKNLYWLSRGEFVNNAASVDKFGAEFYERLNQGVIDLSAVRRYADGGLVGGGGSGSGAGVVGGGETNIFVSAFDQQTTVEALARVLEPAQVRRGYSRTSGKAAAVLARQLRPRMGY